MNEELKPCPLPSADLFCHQTIPEPLSEEERRWLVEQLHRYPKRVNEARTCAIGALTDMATTEFCRLMGELSANTVAPKTLFERMSEVQSQVAPDDAVKQIALRVSERASEYIHSKFEWEGVSDQAWDELTVALYEIAEEEVAERLASKPADGLREALELFVKSAVMDEHTHRVTVDEWVLSQARAALSLPQAKGDAE